MNRWIAALLTAALLLAACSAEKHAAESEAKPSALVTTAAVIRGDIAETVTAYGAAEFMPTGERTLSAPIEAQVAGVLAAPGSAVRSGEPLIRLAPSAAVSLELQKAVQDARTTSEAYARSQRLRATGLNSDADVETARAAASTASITLRSLRGRLGGLTVRSPISGVVEGIAVAPGDLVAAGANLGKVGSLSAVRVRLGVDPRLLTQLRPGDPVTLGAAEGGPPRPARIAAVDPRADAQTRLAGVLVQVSGEGLAPGQPVRGGIVLRRHAGVAVIPRQAVLYEGDKPYAFVAAGGVAHRRELVLGLQSDDRVEVVQGLTPGERVVVEGGAALEDGMAVREQTPVPAP